MTTLSGKERERRGGKRRGVCAVCEVCDLIALERESNRDKFREREGRGSEQLGRSI